MSDDNLREELTQNGSGENSVPDSGKEKPEKKNARKEVFSWIKVVVAAIMIALVVDTFLIANAVVPTGSMENTIPAGARIIGLRFSYLFSEPERGDIIIFKYPDDESKNFLKRIIGLPGETLEIKDGKVYINGSETPLEEDYLAELPYGDFGPYEIPEDCYFVMGDNRNNSRDSRYWENTFVRRDEIIAKAVWMYYPKMKILTGVDYGT